MVESRKYRRSGKAAAWLLLGLAAACSEPQDVAVLTEPATAVETLAAHGAHASVSLNQDLAALRAMTARYRNLEDAIAAGWDVLVPGCRDNPPVGGMGWHYLNPAYLGLDLQVLEPQVLIYEPEKNGRMRFVGVEYLIPFDLLPAEAEPPVLMGQEFLQNFGDNVWMLHVWVGRHNPDGMFATWNPHVSCQYAD